jgi:asparagine synthase (glutamine-hydrolysing)
MCGIYGVLSKNRQLSPVDVASFNECFKKYMGHRGPDDSGYFVSPNNRLLLGHLRLSIIDIDNGKQPMKSSDENNIVVFNGEIYNYRELKASSRYLFTTASDTEVLLSEYQDKGLNFCNRLNGMYGLALYDSELKVLSLAVDPLGIKSIYIFENDDYVVFSSELVPLCKFINQVLSIPLEADSNATQEFLYHGLFLNDKTPVKGIMKVLPGSIVSYSLDDNKKNQYEIRYEPTSDNNSTLDDVLLAAVNRQLVSDVPICLFLSGGIDSSLLATYLAQNKSIVKAYTFGFPSDSTVDESANAVSLAKSLNMEYEVVQLSNKNLQEAFYNTIDNMDEPISDFATIPLMELSKVAGLNYKVCLLGDGGDELFYGYTHHKFWFLKLFFAKSIFNLLKITDLLSRLSYICETNKNVYIKKLGLLLKTSTPYSTSYGPFSNCLHFLIDKKNNGKSIVGEDELLKWEKINPLNRKLLQKTDRITMQQGLEARVPLLDLEVVYFSKTYSKKDCIVSGKGKIPLRKLLDKKYASDVSTRKKQGFRTPADRWLREGLGIDIHQRLIDCRFLPMFISSDSITRLFNEHNIGKIDHSSRILTLFVLSNFWNKITY